MLQGCKTLDTQTWEGGRLLLRFRIQWLPQTRRKKGIIWRRNCRRMETVEDEWCKGCLWSRYCEEFFCMSKWDSNHDGWAIWSCFCFWCLDLFVHSVAFGSKVLMLEMLRGRMRRRRNVVAGRSPEQGEPVRERRRRRRRRKRTAVNLQHKKIKTQVKTSLCSRSRRNHAWWMPWQRRRWETGRCSCWRCLWVAKICKMLQGCKPLDMQTWGGREAAAALQKSMAATNTTQKKSSMKAQLPQNRNCWGWMVQRMPSI